MDIDLLEEDEGTPQPFHQCTIEGRPIPLETPSYDENGTSLRPVTRDKADFWTKYVPPKSSATSFQPVHGVTGMPSQISLRWS